jgi:DNA-binding CsgD family transcriptional regulator
MSDHSVSGRPEQLLEKILDRFVRATFAVDSSWELLYQNAAARALSAKQTFVQINDGRLHFLDRGLVRQIAEYFSGSPENKTMMLPAIDRHTHIHTEYRLLVTPLESDKRSAAERIWLLFVSEFVSERHIESEVLQQLYRLTRSEALLVSSLFAGDTLAMAARSRDISINTAKTLLRRVFQKCEVQSQGELLQLVALGPRAL